MPTELTDKIINLHSGAPCHFDFKEDLLKFLTTEFLNKSEIYTLTNTNPRQFVEDIISTFVKNFFTAVENACANEALRQLLWFIDIGINHEFKREFYERFFKLICDFIEHENIEKKEEIYSLIQTIINNLEYLISTATENIWHREPSRDLREFLTFLKSGDVKSCINFLLRKIKEKDDVTKIVDEYIAPAMEHIGYLWQSAKLTIPEEHLITGNLLKVLTELRKRIKFKSEDEEKLKDIKILILLPPSERHQLSAIAMSDILEILGYSIYYIGYNYNYDKLKKILISFRPSVVCISITLPEYLNEVKEIARIIISTPISKPKIILGSALCKTDPELHIKVSVDYCCKSLSEFIKTIKKFTEEQNGLSNSCMAVRY